MAFGIDDAIGLAGGIGGGLLGLFGGESAADVAQEQYGNLPTTFTPEMLPYLQLGALQNYATPEDLTGQTIADNPELQAMQMNTLNQLKDIQEKGFTPAQQNAFTQASRAANTQAQGEQGAIMADLAAKGRSGAGIEAALRQMASQAASERASQQMLQQAQAEAEARQNANSALLAGASQVRAQDVGVQGQNANILNEFNKLNSKTRQDTANANVDLANQRAITNYNQQNTVNAANTQAKNAAKQLDIANKYAKAAGITGQANNTINPQYAGLGQMIGQAAGNIAGTQYTSPTATKKKTEEPNA